MRRLQVTVFFVCMVAATCLISLSECWTVHSFVLTRESNIESQPRAESRVVDVERKGRSSSEKSVDVQKENVESQLQNGIVAQSRLEEAAESRSIEKVGSNQSNVEFILPGKAVGGNGRKEREQERNETMEMLPRLHEENWCRKMRSFSGAVFGFPLEDEKDSWPKFKLSWRTGSALMLGGLGAAISSAGGLGGGGLFVPLFNLLLQFDAKTSAALSNFLILGGSLANLYINLQQAHPTAPDKPLIDFDVVLLLQPNMLLGISTGVILNVMLPDWVITALLTATLSYMSFHSFKCGLKRWKKETQQNRLRKDASYVPAPDFHHHSSSEDDAISDDDIPRNGDEVCSVANGHGEYPPKTVDSSLKEDALSQPLLPTQSCRTFSIPVNSILVLAFTWLAFFAVQVLRGSKDNQSIFGIEACGFWYWVITFAQIPIGLGMTAWIIRRFHKIHACKEDPECIQEEGFVLKPESCTIFAWMALFTGLLGGLLGIGGGMIINPILLTIGMIPQVTAATCASMVFFSSSMSVVQFWLMGRVPLEFALSGALLCAVSSFAGVTLLHRAIDKYNRASLIVFSVTAVMAVSAFLMAGFGGVGVWDKYRSGGYMGFHYPC